MRKAIWLLSIALAVLAVSCGSETEDAQTTSVAPIPDTSATTTIAESGTATAAGADEEYDWLIAEIPESDSRVLRLASD